MKRTTFFATEQDGTRHRWAFWREKFMGGFLWCLETHDGCFRTLEGNWINSVPRIHAIAENYGMTVEVS